MIKWIREKVRHNLGLKILSVIIAIVIWYVVVNANDPVVTRSYTVDVAFQNQAYIQSGKQTYKSDDTYKSVVVYLRANRSTLRGIDAEDISVTADLTQIVSMETTPVMVPLSVSCPGIDQAGITLSRTAIPITIENIASKEFSVNVDTNGTMPGKDYEVGSATPDPEQIVINGPESVVNSIDTVVARIDVTGMTQDGERTAVLSLIDKNQAEISSATIENELSFDMGTSAVGVYIDLWRKKTEVGFEYHYSGSPAEGYQVSGLKSTPETITVAGDDAALTALSAAGNKLEIPGDLVPVDGASSDVSVEVSLAELLPENMRLSSNTSDTITVTAGIIPEDSLEMGMDVDRISIRNLAQGLSVSYDQTELTVRVQGSSGELDSLKESDISASIDLSGLAEGDYSIPVNITLPSGIRLVEDVSINVHLKEAAKT